MRTFPCPLELSIIWPVSLSITHKFQKISSDSYKHWFFSSLYLFSFLIFFRAVSITCTRKWNKQQPKKKLWTTTTWILTCRRCRSMIIRYHGNVIVNFDSERGGISLEQEKSETGTTSRLLLTKATFRDSGNYSCVPLGALSASVIVHVLNGNWKRLFLFIFTSLGFYFFCCCSSTFHIHSVIFSRPGSHSFIAHHTNLLSQSVKNSVKRQREEELEAW